MSGQAKHTATISLIIMAAGFLATLLLLPRGNMAGAFLLGGFEAGLVGGLADWFAVTALFRHPLGIPIPHTALLPNNREKITNAFVSAVENNLLNKESIAAKIREFRPAEHLLEMAFAEIHTDEARGAMVSLSRKAIENIPVDKLVGFAETELKQRIAAASASALLERAVGAAVSRGYDAKTADFVLERAELWAIQPETRQKIGSMAMQLLQGIQLNGLMQFAMNAFLGFMTEDKMGSLLQNFILGKISDLRTPGHPQRETVLSFLRGELAQLPRNKQLTASLDEWKNQLADEWKLGEALHKVALELKQRALDFVEAPGYAGEHAIPLLEKLLGRLQSSPETVQRIEDWIQSKVSILLEENHSRIGGLVRENIDKMDNATLTEMLEDKVGKDLQWIRVNGAVCGFAIGLILTAVRLLV